MDKEPQPGSFYLEPDPFAGSPKGEQPDQSKTVAVPEASPDVVAEFQLACEEFGIDPKVIYSPCCETNVTPSRAFPQAKVIYLDNRDYPVGILREAGYNVVKADAKQYVPEEEVDLVILENPQIGPDFVARTVKPGGHVFCNDYSHTAVQMAKLPDFELLGLIQRTSDQEPIKVVSRQGAEELLATEDENQPWGQDFGQFVFKRKLLKRQE